MRLRDGARVAVIGAGPSGLTSAKHALQAGFEPTVFEASDALGGQWHSAAPHSGVWPGMRANTSRAMTAFSDFPAPADHALHPLATQIHAYLGAYADAFGVTERIRFGFRVEEVRPGWTIDGEPFDAVVVASGRFRKPSVPGVLRGFGGKLLHAFDYPGAKPLAGRRTLVYGNGISGLEIASDLASHTPVVSAYRTPRYVIRKVVEGVSSDWQWYTLFGALERRLLAPDVWARRQRERILRVAGSPADFGAPAPDDDPRVAGISLCQDYLQQVRDGSIVCRPGIAAVDGTRVTFTDGTSETVDVIVAATGYAFDVPYLPELGPELFHRTFHPDLPGLGVIGQFLAQGPYLPLLELQARWIVAVWSGDATLPGDAEMRSAIAQPRPPLDAHNALALTLAEQFGVAPEPLDWPELTEPLVFGPLLPPPLPAQRSRRDARRCRSVRRPARGLPALGGRSTRPRRPPLARLGDNRRGDRRCREAGTGSAHQVKGHDERGHDARRRTQMTLKRMDNVLIVVEDLEAAMAFFAELGMALEGRTQVEGPSVDRTVGLSGVRADIAMMRAPDGHGRVELTRFHSPAAVRTEPEDAPANALGIRRIMFAVEGIDDVVARLRNHGAELLDDIAQYEDAYRLCFMRGPEGIIIGLAEQLG